MSVEIALEALKDTLAKAREDEKKSADNRATIADYSRGIDAGLVIGLTIAVEAIERGLA